MKTILCYGDSNTWGYNPLNGGRYRRDERWTGVLRNALPDEMLVIEEGLNGRTTVLDDPLEDFRNGKTYFVPCLQTHRPLDLVIIMLGTNDLKTRFSLPACDIAQGAGVLVRLVQQSDVGQQGCAPKVLLLAPPPVASQTDLGDAFNGAEAKSRLFAQCYGQVAEETGCHFFDTATVIVSSDLDGIHFDGNEHRKLGQALAPLVRDILKV